ncbi:MAG: AAA family ATPase [Flavobacteriales bacterium]|nr:AAA family ATPase [Flavobacteriales bacterium]
MSEIEDPKSKDYEKKFDKLINKFKTYLDQDSDEKNEFEIDFEFLNILKKEGEKIWGTCEDLNADKNFVNAINRMLRTNDSALDFKSQHLLLHDITRAYKLIIAAEEETHIKTKFALAYLFERLQGHDMTTSITIDRINQLVSTDKFHENIDKIVDAEFLKLPDNYKNEFILPSILTRLEHEENKTISSFIYRMAQVYAKANGEISESEKSALKDIADKVNKPKKEIEGVKQVEVEKDDSLEAVMAELNGLIGLTEIKKAVSDLTDFLKVQKIREEKGLKNVDLSLHMVFMGPPGTGKTTIARLVGRIYKHINFLEKGHLVETDRAGMVAGYVGQTAMKVDEVVKTAIGGVLFIDEAYSLANNDGQRDFGNEAVETLLKRMEDHRKELVVIVAGYPDEMEEFINSNPGLHSRFNRYFTFDHYQPQELMGIFKLFANKADFKLDEVAEEKLLEIIEQLYEKKHPAFGNARVMRNLFEKIIERQASRIVGITPITEEILMTLTEKDIPAINKTVDEVMSFTDQ